MTYTRRESKIRPGHMDTPIRGTAIIDSTDNMPCKQVLKLKISLGSYKDILSEITSLSNRKSPANVCFANVHMLIESYLSPSFNSIINNADIVVADGIPLTWALRFINGVKQERISGMDMLPDLLKVANTKHLPVYFYGGTKKMLQETEECIKRKYPNIPIAGMFSPPFRPLSEEEKLEVATNIRRSGAKIVFVVLGCPKQEKWMAEMKSEINALMVGVGGALPVLIGWQKRAPKWMEKNGLEWLFRLYQEPKRLFRRYAFTNSFFIYLLIKETIKVRLLKKVPATFLLFHIFLPYFFF